VGGPGRKAAAGEYPSQNQGTKGKKNNKESTDKPNQKKPPPFLGV